METITKIRDFLAGRKTYILAVVGALTAVAAWSTGEIDGEKLVVALYAAATAASMRAGVAKSGPAKE